MVKREYTQIMDEVLVWLHSRQYNKMFWANVPPYTLNRRSYEAGGLLMIDMQRLIGCTYAAVHKAVRRLVQAKLIIAPYGDNVYILTGTGKRRAEALIKLRQEE